MPTYDYECENCKVRFEYFQSITDELLKNCPKCNSPVKRLISTGAGLIFKGKGFYRTDYKNSGAKPESKSEDKPAPCGKSEKCACCE